MKQVLENVDNNTQKNNLRIKGLKEGTEGCCLQTGIIDRLFWIQFRDNG